MLNSLARNKGSRRWLGLCLFAIAFLFAALVSGCGGSGSSGSGGGAPAKEFSNVIFHFNDLVDGKILARAVPDGTTQIRFTGSTSSREVLYGPTIRDYAPTITLEKVPVRVTGFVLECLNSNNGLTAIIPVKVELNGYRDTTVTISESPALSSVVKNVVVKPTEIKDLLVGSSESFTAVATLSDGQIVDLTPYLTFSSSKPEVATVEQNGYDGAKITASKGGETVISGSVLGVDMPEIKVTVNAGVVEKSVAFSPEKVTVPMGRSRELTAQIVYSDNSKGTVSADRVTYTVEPAAGVVTIEPTSTGCKVIAADGVGSGATATVTMTVTNEGEEPFTAKAEVTITDKEVESIAITNDTEGDMLNKLYPTGTNNACQFTATATYSDGSTDNVTATATWNSNTEAAAKFGETKGKLEAIAVGTTTVTAELDGITSNAIAIEVVNPGVTKIQTSVDDPEKGFVAYIKDGVGQPYAITVKAVYANGEEKVITVADELTTCEFFRTKDGEVSGEYVDFQDGENNVINIVPKKKTDEATGSYIRFTYDGIKSDDIKVTINDVVPEVLAINLVDEVTNKVYNINPTDGTYEVGIPYGRSYKIVVRAKANNGEDLGDISGNYEFSDGVTRGEGVELSLAHPVLVPGVTEENEYSSTAQIQTYGESYEKMTWSNEALYGNRRYISYMDTTTEEPQEKQVGDNDIITVTGRNKADKVEAFKVKIVLKDAAVDSYLAAYKKSSGTTFDIPRGVDFNISASGEHKVKAQMSYKASETTSNLVDVTDLMSIDEESITPLLSTFLVEKKSDGVYSSVTAEDIYSSRNELKQTGEITMINKRDAESEKFGCAAYLNGPFQSYNVEPAKFTLKLERPIILGYAPGVYDENGAALSASSDGTYHFSAGTKFKFLLSSPVLSDKGKNPDGDFLAGTSDIIGMYYKDVFIKVVELLKPKTIDSFYQMSEDEKLSSGNTSTIKITPSSEAYYNPEEFVKQVIVTLDK